MDINTLISLLSAAVSLGVAIVIFVISSKRIEKSDKHVKHTAAISANVGEMLYWIMAGDTSSRQRERIEKELQRAKNLPTEFTFPADIKAITDMIESLSKAKVENAYRSKKYEEHVTNHRDQIFKAVKLLMKGDKDYTVVAPDKDIPLKEEIKIHTSMIDVSLFRRLEKMDLQDLPQIYKFLVDMGAHQVEMAKALAFIQDVIKSIPIEEDQS